MRYIAAMTEGTKRIAIAAAGVTLAGVAAMAVKTAGDRAARATSTRTVTIGRDVAQTFAAWRALHARAFDDFADVTPGPDGSTRWQLRPPLSASWETRIIDDRPGGLLRWAEPDAPGRFEGSFDVRPAPGDRGTEVTLSLTGPVSRPVVGTVLRRFKSLVEAGEAPTLEANPSGRS